MVSVSRTRVPQGWRTDMSHLDAIEAPALAADTSRTVIWCNSPAEHVLGRPCEQLCGADLVELLADPYHHGPLGEVVGQVLGGSTWAGELPVVVAGGTERRAGLTVTPLRRDADVVGLLLLLEPGSHGRPLESATRAMHDRLTRIARVTAELASVGDMDTLTRTVITRAADAAGATVASLMTLVDEDTFALTGLRGGGEGAASRWATFPLSAHTPAGDSVRSGRPVVLSGRDAIQAAYPDLESAAPGERSLVSLPLAVAGHPLGAIALAFPGRRVFDSSELEYLGLLADTCAQAIERIRAVDAAEDRSRKLTFLADASAKLATSLDYEETLREVAWLGVPAFADWCAISLVEDGDLRTLEVAHTDPDKVALAREVQERYPTPKDATYGTWQVIRSARTELVPEVTDEMLVAATKDEEHLRMLRALGLRSGVSVPLLARGKVLGVITWVSGEHGRRFSQDDLSFVEDLASRAAVAIDNAQLHSETREASVRLQRAILPDELPTVPGWEVAAFYSPSGRTAVGGDFYDVVPLDGVTALFVGDVMGRGVGAAAAMAQMRASLRAYAAIDPRPAAVMHKLDLLFSQLEVAQLVTVLYAVVDAGTGELIMVNAGHPPPVVLRADGSVEQVTTPVSAPFGAEPDTRRELTAWLRAGDTLLLFTDGLIERRDEDIDRGQSRVLDACTALAGADLATGLADLVTEVRDHTREDDVAVLAVRRAAR